jgi:hypothetical protein
MPSILLRVILLILSLISSLFLHAQTADPLSKNLTEQDSSAKKISQRLQRETLSSVLLDSLTKSPIAYASIVLKNNQGVITNEEGAFSIQLPKICSYLTLLQCLLWATRKNNSPFSSRRYFIDRF